MDTVSLNKFRDNLKSVVETTTSRHEPVRVTRRAGDDLIVMSADDWEREQDTLFVFKNNELMKKIAESSKSHSHRAGYKPTNEQMNEIPGL